MPFFTSTAGGSVSHDRKHCCSPGSNCPDNSPDQPSARPTSDLEYVKFARRLMSDRKNVLRDKLLEQYKASWLSLYPNQPIALTPDGLPVDHARDPNHPCPNIPWLTQFLNNDIQDEASSSSGQNPVASSSSAGQNLVSSSSGENPITSSSSAWHNVVPSSSGQNAVASSSSAGQNLVPSFSGENPVQSSSLGQNPNTSLSFTPTPSMPPLNSPAPQPEEDSSTIKGEVTYLQQLNFQTLLNYPYPRLDGLFPQMRGYRQDPVRCLQAFFVLCPQYELTREYVGSTYFTEGEIDEADEAEIRACSPSHIKRVQKEASPGKVVCAYHTWVSRPVQVQLFIALTEISKIKRSTCHFK